MKTKLILISTMLVAGAIAEPAKPKLTDAHVEVGINFDGTHWDWVASDETNEEEYEPDDVVLFVEPGSKTTVPDNPNYRFLGRPGRPVWIVPQIIDPNLLTVGISAEEMPTGVLLNDVFDLRVVRVHGPGEFALYEVDAFGVPEVFVNTRHGLNSKDHVPMFAGFHGHFNWAFSEPGIYHVTFQAFGAMPDGRPVASHRTTYTFFVSPHSRPFRSEL